MSTVDFRGGRKNVYWQVARRWACCIESSTQGHAVKMTGQARPELVFRGIAGPARSEFEE